MSSRVSNWMGEDVYLGASKALVIDNKDPSFKGRIRVSSPVFGKTGFIPYITVEDGFYSPPDVGSVVYIEADGGDEDFLIAWGTVNDGPDTKPDTRSEFKRLIPTNRGWASTGSLDAKGKPVSLNSGHLIELDDGIAMSSNGTITQTKESKGMRLVTSGGHYIKLWEEGSDGASKNRIEFGTSGGQVVQMTDTTDSSGQKILIKDKDGRAIEIAKDSDHIHLKDPNNSKYIHLDFASSLIELESTLIKLGKNAVEPTILGTSYETYHNAEIVAKLNMLIVAVTTLAAALPSHTHPYTWTDPAGSGVTGPPSPDGAAAAGQIPPPAAVATPALLTVKTKAE